MAGEVSIDRRLSPSGRFIKDSLSGFYLPLGSGTPGLVWRGQLDATYSPTNIGGTAGTPPVILVGVGGDWALPLGYRYDVQSFLTVRGGTIAGHNTGDLIVLVEGSTDSGSTWTVTLLTATLPAVILYSNESRCFNLASPIFGPLTADITTIRTRALCTTGATASDATIRNDTWTKIAQYVA